MSVFFTEWLGGGRQVPLAVRHRCTTTTFPRGGQQSLGGELSTETDMGTARSV
jgi:hypothetical protein